MQFLKRQAVKHSFPLALFCTFSKLARFGLHPDRPMRDAFGSTVTRQNRNSHAHGPIPQTPPTITSEPMLFVEQTPLGPPARRVTDSTFVADTPRPEVSQQIVKDHSRFPYFIILRQNGPTLAGVAGIGFPEESTRSFSVLANECVGLGRAAGGTCRWRSWLGEELVEPLRGRGLGSSLDLRFELSALGFPFLDRQVLERTTLEYSVPV